MISTIQHCLLAMAITKNVFQGLQAAASNCSNMEAGFIVAFFIII